MTLDEKIAALHQIATTSEMYACRNEDSEWIESHIDRVLLTHGYTSDEIGLKYPDCVNRILQQVVIEAHTDEQHGSAWVVRWRADNELLRIFSWADGESDKAMNEAVAFAIGEEERKHQEIP
ncbi:MAG TPA: hypothetical protein VD837_14430 [Terriglobales bacterium]|nr:hypothetical protein [Terriglobales bacterium]